MKLGLAVAAAAGLLCLVKPASAHRLDEYLQATTIAVEKTRVTAQIRLTPGVATVHAVLADIDTDHDGLLSAVEQRAYAERVLRDLSLTLDGHPLPLQTTSFTFPSMDEMTGGLGEILLTFRADIPPGGLQRQLIFENHHRSALSAYLANCLFPADPEIRVTAQNHNYDQSVYRIDYTQPADR